MTSAISAIIPGGISLDDFTAITHINATLSQQILDTFVENGIGTLHDSQYHFLESDRLSAALMLLKKGALVDDVAIYLDWKSFEGLTAQILESKGFAIIKNLILKKPRRQIDVIGINHGIAILIDCKHWKRYSRSALSEVVQKQVERTKQYVKTTQGSMAIPVIVTLYHDRIDFIDKVPIVPILQFSSFIDEFYGNLDDLNTIETK